MTLPRLTSTLVAALVCVIALTGCLRPYRMDVQQGNVVTEEMLASLKPGMSQREVKFILGSPMIEDPFHADRWDYVYSLREGRSSEREQSVVTVMFDNGKLVNIKGTPSANAVDARRIRLDDPFEANPEKAKKKRKNPFTGIWDRVKGIGKKKAQ